MTFTRENQKLSYPSTEDQAPVMHLHFGAGKYYAFQTHREPVFKTAAQWSQLKSDFLKELVTQQNIFKRQQFFSPALYLAAPNRETVLCGGCWVLHPLSKSDPALGLRKRGVKRKKEGAFSCLSLFLPLHPSLGRCLFFPWYNTCISSTVPTRKK